MNEEQYDDKCPCCGRSYEVAPKKPRRDLKAIEADFNTFWAAYPRKTGKGAARTAWAKNNLPPIADILAALRKAILSPDWQKEQGKYIPNPSTWLNQGRYEDEGIDYQALSQRPIASSSTTTKINPDHAEEWRKENYELSPKLPFEMWPLHIRKQYLATLKP